MEGAARMTEVRGLLFLRCRRCRRRRRRRCRRRRHPPPLRPRC